MERGVLYSYPAQPELRDASIVRNGYIDRKLECLALATRSLTVPEHVKLRAI